MSCSGRNADVQTAKDESSWSSAREHCCKWRRTVRGKRARKAIVGCDLFPPLSLTSSRGTASSDTGEWEDCLRPLTQGGRLLLGTYVPYVYVCVCMYVVFVHAYAIRYIGGVASPSHLKSGRWIYLGFSSLRYRVFTRSPRTSLLSAKKPMWQDYSTKLGRMSHRGWSGRSIVWNSKFSKKSMWSRGFLFWCNWMQMREHVRNYIWSVLEDINELLRWKEDIIDEYSRRKSETRKFSGRSCITYFVEFIITCLIIFII